MASLIAIPLKKSYDVDLIKPLTTLITSNYNQNANSGDLSNLDEAIRSFNTARSNCISRFSDIKDESSMEIFEQYYDHLANLEVKVPTAAIQAQFKWKDAFDKGGSWILSSGSLSISNLSYDKVCVLFNIAAAHSQIACSIVIDASLNNDIALKKASKHFQIASGIFQALKHIASTSVGDHDLTIDLSGEALTLLETICLAQSQEMFYYKASNDNLKANLIAQIANQCEHLYGDALKQVQLVKLSGYEKEWLSIISLKQHSFKALAEYYQALVAKQNKEFGEVITRLQKSVEQFKMAEGKTSTFFSSHFRDSLNSVSSLLDEVRKDNEFIYHAKIPDYKSVKIIGNAQLAKPTPLPAKFHPQTPGLFEKLLPVAVQDAMARFEIQKQETINTSIATLREHTNLLNGLLASMNLPAALEDTGGLQLPPSIMEKAAEVKKNGGINEIERLINDLPMASKRNSEIVEETERQLLAEEESDNNLRAQFKEKWTRTPSAKLNESFKTYVAKYKVLIKNGLEADAKIKEKFLTHRDKIMLLSSDNPEQLLSSIPTESSPAMTNLSNSNCVKELKSLMSQVESLRSRREYLENEIKKVSFDDIKQTFLAALAQDGAINQQALSTEAIGERFSSIQREIRSLFENQERIIENIRKYNEEFVNLKRNFSSGSSEREKFFIDLATAGNAYIEIMGNLKEGTNFYNDITSLLVSLQSKVNDFSFARKAEREDHCKDLQNNIITQSASQTTPNTPSYHSSAPVKPPRPPPPTVTSESQSPAPVTSTATSGAPYAASQAAPPPNPYQPYYYPPPPLPTSYNPYFSQGQPYPTQQYQTYYQPAAYPAYPAYPQQQQPPPQHQQQQQQQQQHYPFSQPYQQNPYPPQ